MKLIIQVESLYRLGIAEDDIDLVVLDESESILEQFSSGLHGNFNASWAMFENMIKRAKHVVCMDANLENMTVNTMLNIRGEDSAVFHHNTFKNMIEDKYYFTTSQETWLAKLHEYLKNNKKIVIPANSLTLANAVNTSIVKAFPNKRVRIYSSETKNSTKSEHFADVAKHWDGLDVLIYTPTCSAGVSFELEHFDALFGYFTDLSCTVETCRQMLARVRILKSREHHIFISSQIKFHPTDIDEIKNQLRNNRSALFQEHGGPVVPWHYGDYGEILFYESPYFKLWVETIRIRNLSKNNFILRFIQQVRNGGAEISELPALALDEEFKLLFVGSKTENNLYYITRVAESPNITDETAAFLYQKQEAQDDIEPEEKYSLEKYNLLSYYRLPKDQVITPDFVEKYNSPKTKEIFRNLRVFEGYSSVEVALDDLKHRESSYYRSGQEYAHSASSLQASACDHHDLVKSKYSYTRHYIATSLLSLCGLKLFDLTPTNMLLINLEKNRSQIIKRQDEIVREFEIWNTQLSDNEKMIKFINCVLKKMYGIQIRKTTIGLFAAHCLEWDQIHIQFIVSGEPVAIDGPVIATKIMYEKLTGPELINKFRANIC